MKKFKLKIKLDGTSIWRLFEIKGDADFAYLHTAIQIIMGWKNYHLYEFKLGDISILEEESEEKALALLVNNKYSTLTPIKKLLEKGQKIHYIYDFGDMWKHTIEVTDVIPCTESVFSATCLDGAKNCPPDDVGSIDGYKKLVKAVKTKNKDYNEYRNWLGYEYDADDFDVVFTNKVLQKYL